MVKKKLKVRKPPYTARSDAEKIQSQWTKLSGLHRRNEPSAAIVRAATAAELAVNLAVRAEFADQSTLSPDTVNAMLRKANGLWGKVSGLLLPLVIDRPNEPAIKKLCRASDQINKNRNDIVHSGQFSNRAPALKVIERCRRFSNSLVQLYEPNFELRALAPSDLEEAASGSKSEDPNALKVKPRKKSKTKLKNGRQKSAQSKR